MRWPDPMEDINREAARLEGIKRKFERDTNAIMAQGARQLAEARAKREGERARIEEERHQEVLAAQRAAVKAAWFGGAMAVLAVLVAIAIGVQ